MSIPEHATSAISASLTEEFKRGYDAATEFERSLDGERKDALAKEFKRGYDAGKIAGEEKADTGKEIISKMGRSINRLACDLKTIEIEGIGSEKVPSEEDSFERVKGFVFRHNGCSVINDEAVESIEAMNSTVSLVLSQFSDLYDLLGHKIP